MANEVRITVRADGTQKTNAELGSVDKKASGLGGTVQGLQKNWLAMGAAAGVAAVGLVGVGRAVVGLAMLASDLEESQNKVNVVFGESAESINDFASTAATALGQTETAVLAAAGGFGAMFSAIGLAKDISAEMSVGMVQLSADMASFNNIDTASALEKLRAGLAGEAEPLRQLGVFLSAARVEAKALELGLAATTAEIDESAKITARYAIIMQDTGIQQGDFARTSDGLANQTRILSAQFDEMKTALGELVVGPLTSAVSGMNDLFIAMNKLVESSPFIVTMQVLRSIVDTPGAVSAAAGFVSGIGGAIQQAGGEFLDLISGGPNILDRVQAPFSARSRGGGGISETEIAAIAAAEAARVSDAFARPGFGRGGGGQQQAGFDLIFSNIERTAREAAGREAKKGGVQLSEIERALQSARANIAAEQTSEIVNAFITGGDEAVSIVRQEQANLDSAWQDVAAGIQELGFEAPDRFRSMWEEMLDIQEKEQQALLDQRKSFAERARIAEQAILAGTATVSQFAFAVGARRDPGLSPEESAAAQAERDRFQSFLDRLLVGEVSPTMDFITDKFGAGMASVIESLIANQQIFINAIGNLQARIVVELDGEAFTDAVVKAEDNADATGRTTRTLVN